MRTLPALAVLALWSTTAASVRSQEAHPAVPENDATASFALTVRIGDFASGQPIAEINSLAAPADRPVKTLFAVHGARGDAPRYMAEFSIEWQQGRPRAVAERITLIRDDDDLKTHFQRLLYEDAARSCARERDGCGQRVYLEQQVRSLRNLERSRQVFARVPATLNGREENVVWLPDRSSKLRVKVALQPSTTPNPGKDAKQSGARGA